GCVTSSGEVFLPAFVLPRERHRCGLWTQTQVLTQPWLTTQFAASGKELGGAPWQRLTHSPQLTVLFVTVCVWAFYTTMAMRSGKKANFPTMSVSNRFERWTNPARLDSTMYLACGLQPRRRWADPI